MPATEGLHAVRVRIEGRVQGVGFRVWVERTATGLGLAGWVRNRRDGGVEAAFSGAPGQVAIMLDLCRSGPRASTVEMLKIFDDSTPTEAGFDIKPTV